MASIGASGPTHLAVQPTPVRELTPLPAEGYGDYGRQPAREISLGLLWRVALEWRWLILAAFGVGIAASVLITLLTPLSYRATTVLELNPPQLEVLDDAGGGRRATQAQPDAAFIGTQIGLLSSRALAERVVQDLNLAAETRIVGVNPDRQAATQTAIGYVEAGLSTKLQPNSRLVRINFVSRVPALAAKIVNGAADAYISTNLERRYQSSSYARTFLEKQIATTRRELERSERDLVAYAQQQRLINTGTGSLGTDANSDTNSLTGNNLLALNNALGQTQARRIAAEQRYREAQLGGPSTESGEAVGPLRQQIATLNAEYQQKLQTFRPDYPEMAAMKSRIDALRSSVASETRNAGANRAGSLRADYEAARREEARLRAQVSQLSASVLDQRGRRIKYNILQRDVDTNRTLYDGLLQRFKEVGVASGVGNASASIVDRGTPPSGAFSPNLYLNLAIGAALGLLSGLLTALALEFVNDTIKTPDDVRDKLQLPFLGGIPSAKLARPVDELKDPLSGVTEAYLSTATALQFVTEGGAPKTMLVTSTRPAEGKSTSAWALAQSYSRLGKTVLLIDADMRRPAFVTGHSDIGLSHILTSTGVLSDHTLKTDVEGLWMLPSGPVPPSPPELLASPRCASLLAEAAATFDLVVIDGPPILGLADAPLLSTLVKGTLLVVETGKTRTRAAVEAHNRLKTAGSHALGAILTRYEPQASYGYGYGYGQNKDQYKYVADDESRKRRILLTVKRDD